MQPCAYFTDGVATSKHMSPSKGDWKESWGIPKRISRELAVEVDEALRSGELSCLGCFRVWSFSLSLVAALLASACFLLAVPEFPDAGWRGAEGALVGGSEAFGFLAGGMVFSRSRQQ